MFKANNVVVNKNTNNDTQENFLASNQLNTKELEIILSLIKRSTFLGEDIEILYNMIIKLQSQYIEQTKK